MRPRGRIDLLSQAISGDAPEDPKVETPFEPLESDERKLGLAAQIEREGLGTLWARERLRRVLRAGEHPEPVLDAAHIQPYLGPRSNHIQDGLLPTKEFHTLFDPRRRHHHPEHVVRGLPRLRSEWHNGKRYFPHHGRQPPNLHSSRQFLSPHHEDPPRRDGTDTSLARIYGCDRELVTKGEANVG